MRQEAAMAGPLVIDRHAIAALCRKYAVYFAKSIASTGRELFAA